ncbi:MAG: NAD(P)-dependent alcohol dehydrogenase [Cyclobacteriaceae bacterium]
MKAAVYAQYGTPDVLHIEDIDKPEPKDNEVLVKVHATSINSWDYDLLTGTTLGRIFGGFRKPRHQVLGCDVSGVVDAIGSKVTLWKVGDEVFGDISGGSWGGFAEYARAKEDVLARKPNGLTHEQASVIPQAGLLALQGLRNVGKMRAGDKVLINGAGGGVGVVAIQLAKLEGAKVTAVDHEGKFDMMQSLGADHVINYKQESFTKNGKQYDLILENIATHSLFDYKRSLAPNGIFCMTGGTPKSLLQMLFLSKLLSVGSRKLRLVALQYSPEDMTYLANLMEAGKISAVIDKCYPLSQTADAFHYIASGAFKGKVVITNI